MEESVVDSHVLNLIKNLKLGPTDAGNYEVLCSRPLIELRW